MCSRPRGLDASSSWSIVVVCWICYSSCTSCLVASMDLSRSRLMDVKISSFTWARLLIMLETFRFLLYLFVHAIFICSCYIYLFILYLFVHVIFICPCYIYLSMLYLFVHAIFICSYYIYLSMLYLFVHAIFICSCYIYLFMLYLFVHVVFIDDLALPITWI